MIDPELKNYLSGINQHLTELNAKKHPGVLRAFFNGMFSALGYVAGLALVIVVLGWVLNKTGLLPAFKQQVSDFQAFMDQAKKVMSVGEGQVQNTKSSNNETILTLPDGRQVKIVQ